jgi:T5SS/PEP-CTERM-associated repeat protein
MRPHLRHRFTATAASIALCLSLLPLPAAAVTRFWSGVTGTADQSANWFPAGVPTAADALQMSQGASAYTLTFPATVPFSASHEYNGGPFSIACASSHTILGTLSIHGALQNNVNVTLNQGTLFARQFLLAGPPNGGNTSFNVFSANARFETTDSTVTNIIGGGFAPSFRILAGSSAKLLGVLSVNACSLLVNGQSTVTLTGSQLQLSSPGPLNVGNPQPISLTVSGAPGAPTSIVNVTNGGRLDIAGATILAVNANSVGMLRVGSTGVFNGLILARGPIYVGRMPSPSFDAGSGTLLLDSKSQLSAFRAIHFGTDDALHGRGQLQMIGSSLLFTGDSLVFYSAPNPSFDMRGGSIQQYGGCFIWKHTAFPLVISSSVATPELAILNGHANPPISITQPNALQALRVGGAGAGLLRLLRAGTTFGIAAGQCVLGDSAGGNGSILVDSLAALSDLGGTTTVGKLGTGLLRVLHGSSLATRALVLGAKAGSVGTVLVRGAGSTATIADTLDVGGYAGLPGGTSSFTADSGSTVNVVPSVTASPVTRIEPGTGTLTIGNGASLNTPGAVIDQGLVVIDHGTLHTNPGTGGLYLLPSGTLAGEGTVEGYVFGQGGATNATGNSGLTFRDTVYSVGHTIGGSVVHFLAPGGFQGSGAFTAEVDCAGDFGMSPAQPIAVTTFTADLFLSATSTLRSRLGDHATRNCDRFVGDATATLAGTLALTPGPGFTPVAGDTFVVIDGSNVGTFDHVTWLGIDATPYVNVVYQPGRVVVVLRTNLAAIEPGSDRAPRTLRFVTNGAPRATSLVLDLPVAASVRVTLFDVAGREVARVHDGTLAAGSHRFAIADANLAGGLYFARAQIGGTNARSLTTRVAHLR